MENKNRMTEYLQDDAAQAETKKAMTPPKVELIETKHGYGMSISRNETESLEGKDIKIELKAVIVQAGRRFKTPADLQAWLTDTLLKPLQAESDAHRTFGCIDLSVVGRDSHFDLEDLEPLK